MLILHFNVSTSCLILISFFIMLHFAFWDNFAISKNLSQQNGKADKTRNFSTRAQASSRLRPWIFQLYCLDLILEDWESFLAPFCCLFLCFFCALLFCFCWAIVWVILSHFLCFFLSDYPEIGGSTYLSELNYMYCIWILIT